ncbi:MAG: alkaline phosphatase [Actinomycetota bacterium]|nr:alkaline phosphatase [Actinomycetota bacterium]
MRKVRNAFIGAATVTAAATALAAGIPAAQAQDGPEAVGPKNVIVMISDGWGYHHIAATDYYRHGRAASQVYERFAVRSSMSTYLAGGSYDPNATWSPFAHAASGATDSAAAATAMATGVKTYDGALGVDTDRKPLTNAFQQAERAGRATGVVTSVQLSHATPAGFVAHNTTRNDYSGIAREMIYNSATDVIMGAGSPCHDDKGQPNGCTGKTQYVGGDATWADLTDTDGALGTDADGDGDKDPWKLLRTREDFQSLTYGTAPSRVLGVAPIAQTLQQKRPCARTAVNPITGVRGCAETPGETPGITSVPALMEMSAAALNVLDEDPDGFGLLIEGGAVDWASHDNSLGRLIEEQSEFNRAVEMVVAWINRHGGWEDNLLVVTGDHECGYLTGPNSGSGKNPQWTEVVNKGQGNLPLAEFHSGEHTNSLVPFYAQGTGSELLSAAADQNDPVRGPYLDNTELGRALHRMLGS